MSKLNRMAAMLGFVLAEMDGMGATVNYTPPVPTAKKDPNDWNQQQKIQQANEKRQKRSHARSLRG